MLLVMVIERIRSIPLIVTLLLVPPAMYLLFDTLLEGAAPGRNPVVLNDFGEFGGTGARR